VPISGGDGGPGAITIAHRIFSGKSMPSVQLREPGELQGFVGRELVVSDWVEITQEMIDTFARATGDHQWIHVDVARARRESPFGTTIAHGFLTLSLLSRLFNSAVTFSATRMGLNYGLNRLRFTAPVKAGARLRARFAVKSVDRIEGGTQMTWDVTVECEGEAKPALVAEWLTRRYD
jgi:acyl dehydratase